jgi:hypothetical protein
MSEAGVVPKTMVENMNLFLRQWELLHIWVLPTEMMLGM